MAGINARLLAVSETRVYILVTQCDQANFVPVFPGDQVIMINGKKFPSLEIVAQEFAGLQAGDALEIEVGHRVNDEFQNRRTFKVFSAEQEKIEPPGWLGIHLASLPRSHNWLYFDIEVVEVIEGSPADKAGISVGDTISAVEVVRVIKGSPADKIGISSGAKLAYNSQWDRSFYGGYNLNCYLRRFPSGTIFEIYGSSKKSGAGQEQVYPVRFALGENPYENHRFPSDAKLIELKGGSKLGIGFDKVQVVKLYDGPGKRAGIEVGDVFLTIDGIPVKDVKQITKVRDEVFLGKRSYATILVRRRLQKMVYRLVK